jgi:O-methyltransferase
LTARLSISTHAWLKKIRRTSVPAEIVWPPRTSGVSQVPEYAKWRKLESSECRWGIRSGGTGALAGLHRNCAIADGFSLCASRRSSIGNLQDRLTAFPPRICKRYDWVLRGFAQVMSEFPNAVHNSARLYLDLLKRCVTRLLFPDLSLAYDLVTTSPMVPSARWEGKDWPAEAETMVGMLRLNQLQAAIVNVLEHSVPGDLVETGVWRGGAAILMRAVLKAYGDRNRRVWVADSFEGLPQPEPAIYPRDAADGHHRLNGYLGISLEQVKANFQRYGLLDEQVVFLPGWFKDTLASAPIEQIGVLRLDGDMYESTIQALESLYPKVSEQGFVIIDDYGALPNCRAAVEDFRRSRGIEEPLFPIDWTGMFWRKGSFASSPSPVANGGAPDQ